MKITVKEKQKENKKIPFDEIPVGMVYICSYQKNTMLKLENNEAVALTWDSGVDCLSIAIATKNKPASKILGRLTGIIVEED